MEFDDWYDEEKEKLTKQYLVLGPYALRNILKTVWEHSRETKKECMHEIAIYHKGYICKECRKAL